MSYGQLTVYTGCMYAGKSTHLLKTVLWARHGLNQNVVVIKPAFDNRYASGEIVSHSGLRTEALSSDNLLSIDTTNCSLIALDEVQFFDNSHHDSNRVVEWVRSHLKQRTNVVVSGLDMDWQGRPFDLTAKLISMSDECHKLTADCNVCGRAANKTYKKNKTGGSVELGGTGLYEARCNDHWD